MENLDIFERYILASLFFFPCIYIAIKSYMSGVMSFKKIMTQDTLDNLVSTAAYIFVGQLSIITARAFCSMLSINLIRDDAEVIVTNIFIWILYLYSLYKCIKGFTCLKNCSTQEFLKTLVFKAVFSLIFIQITNSLMMKIVIGIYNMQTLLYGRILEAHPECSEVVILMFSLTWLVIIHGFNKGISRVLGEINVENIDSNNLSV